MSAPIPNPLLARELLSSLQNMHVRMKETVENAQFGWQSERLGSTRAWQEQLSGQSLAAQAFAEQAAAIGVPQAWIDHVRDLGDKGLEWRAGQRMPDAAGVDRTDLLAGLSGQVGRLNEIAALRTVFVERFGPPDSRAELFCREVMSALRERIGALAFALDLTAGERAGLWGQAGRDIRVLAAGYRSLGDRTLVELWEARTTAIAVMGEHVAAEVLDRAGASVDVSAAAGGLPPTAEELMRTGNAELGTSTSLLTTDIAATIPISDAGTAIGHAIEAAGIGADPSATESNSHDFEASPATEPGNDVELHGPDPT
ncbi:hypothetical protein [Nocardia sp. NPDC050435]|uniref:hypothetical protein n=1 Tax=Nocardia sp. NPDC050435 TaxID=3155040 RepID=UPI0033CC332B